MCLAVNITEQESMFPSTYMCKVAKLGHLRGATISGGLVREVAAGLCMCVMVRSGSFSSTATNDILSDRTEEPHCSSRPLMRPLTFDINTLLTLSVAE